MIVGPRRSLDDDTEKTVPEEIPANEHIRDDRDDRDDDLQADSNVSFFLANPPDWYKRQAEECVRRGTPERLLKPLASAVAYYVLGETRRWAEVLPYIEADLKEMGSDVWVERKSQKRGSRMTEKGLP
jgi:hypothetical protein